jgi:hypothetical protein
VEAGIVTDEPKTDTPADPAPPPTRLRIRWGWFLLCIVLGFAAITVGWLLVSSDNRLSYVGGVFGNVGTTLLLVGIVVLLERRIVDTAVKVVRNAAEEARVRTNEEVRAQVRDLEDRLAGVWKTANPEDAAEQTRRMTDEFTKRVVDEYTGEDEPPHAAP